MKKVVFISSTGGHLVELLQLKKMFDNYDYHLITEKTKTNMNLENEFKGSISYLTYGTKKNIFKYLFIFSLNIIKSLYLYLKLKPEYIITTGTHTAVPLCYIGHLFKSKVIYIETFANQSFGTKTGKMIYPIADLFIVQWESLLEVYPNAKYGGWIF